MKKIAVLGGPYTYSDLAAGEDNEKEYFPSIQDVFEAVSRKKVTYGIVPLENLLGGPVEETISALSQYNVEIVREIAFPIHHCLIRKKGEKNTPVKVIYSHKQALAQSQKSLEENYKNVQKKEFPSTFAALEALIESREKGIAAIAPSKAAELRDLDIEKEDIGDQKTNHTLFILIKSK